MLFPVYQSSEIGLTQKTSYWFFRICNETSCSKDGSFEANEGSPTKRNAG